MPQLKISKRTVDAVTPPDPTPEGKPTQVFYRDTELTGFGLKVTNAGTKTYVVEARVQGKPKRITLGKHGPLTAEQARRKAQGLLGDIAMGKDPNAEKREYLTRGVTLKQVYDEYLQTRRDLKPNTLHDYKRCIEVSLGDWLSRPIAEISKEMVEKRHQKLGSTSHARANNTMRVLRALFNFAMEQYEDKNGQPIITLNPVNRLSRNRSWYTVKRRQTLLTPSQLKPWYEATMLLNQETTRDYLHFLLMTGLRRSEATRMTWEDVDFEERTFIIPETKNKEPHRLPMSDFLEDLLKRRYQAAEKVWVFPSPVTDGPLKEPRTAMAKVTEHSGIEFKLHDLRRTFITIAESLDIPAYALKRLLNHKYSNDVTAGYIVPSTERLRIPMQRITDFIREKIEA
ncbi:site-specific recombinase XerD [Marinimicrobium koreense]|uniref:Site-specific recombinase XerD n=1 Tax=Marinimicrobium koreense TaxID=306545 RepID=A0A3N1NWZ2_9GAMM|nr:integrase family protein [Marinimicrobium koreense]ROQ19808.1 site-specific recombinase XerD [Marinimicrobium koreense]